MSDQKDDLKNLFNSAFAAENVEFSPAAWESMNSMLDQKQRKRGFWLWMSSGLATLFLIVASIPFFLQEKNVYEPRIFGQDLISASSLDFTDIELKNQQAPQTITSDNQTTNNESSFKTEDKLASTKSDKSLSKPKAVASSTRPTTVDNTITNQTGSAVSNQGSVKPTSNTTVMSDDQTNSSKDFLLSTPPAITQSGLGNDEGSGTIAEEDHSTQPQVLRSKETIDFLPTLSTHLISESTIIDRENEDEESLTDDSKWNHYMIFGLTRALNTGFKPYPNWGQHFGVGTTFKLRNHLYLSGELAMSRDAVDIVTVTTANKYGFSKTVIDQETRTSEMLFVEMPIMLHYRYNRLKIGGGPMLQYLSGVKNTETRTTQTANGTVLSEDLQNGYFTWNQFNRFNVGLMLDASYQIGEPIHIGIRNNIGLTNIFSTEQTLRHSRLEFYIKLDLP